MEKIICREFSYKINGILFQVHNELGRFRKEKYYADFLERKFKDANIQYEREKPVILEQKRNPDRVDFCIENKILIDIKAKKFITKEDYFQMTAI